MMPAYIDPNPEIDREWHDEVRRVIAYDPLTGDFTWLVNQRRARAGMIAGRITSAGYVQIQVLKKRLVGHRLAWFMVYGRWPEGQIDHRDLDRSNNRIANLRPSSQSQNSANSPMRSINVSGLKGAHKAPRGRYRSEVRKDGHRHDLGYFDTKEEAHAAYAQKAAELFGEFARSS